MLGAKMILLLSCWALRLVSCEGLYNGRSAPMKTALRQSQVHMSTTVPNGGATIPVPAGPRAGPAGGYDACVALGAGKASTPNMKLLTLSFLAGAHIGLGAFLAVSVGGSVPLMKETYPGAQRALMGVFGLPMGLLMVLGGGGELLTGNFALLAAAVAAKKAKMKDLIRNWIVVFFGNFVGSVAFAWLAHVASTGVTPGAIAIATAKASVSPAAAVARGILCNVLVCMAVWMATSQKDIASKGIAVLFPISGFIALGLEHSVANMFLIPFGMMQGASVSLKAFLINNLLPVTIGNAIGGALFVGLAYHNAYGK